MKQKSMNRLPSLVLLGFLASNAACQADEEPKATTPISADLIGRTFHITGSFGPILEDVVIQGTVVKPLLKRDKSEDPETLWLNIEKVRGEAINPRLINQKLFTSEKYPVGTRLTLVIREEAYFWNSEGIDAVLSNPERTPTGKVYCLTKLRVIKVTEADQPPIKK